MSALTNQTHKTNDTSPQAVCSSLLLPNALTCQEVTNLPVAVPNTNAHLGDTTEQSENTPPNPQQALWLKELPLSEAFGKPKQPQKYDTLPLTNQDFKILKARYLTDD